jgi:hypothetical protein
MKIIKKIFLFSSIGIGSILILSIGYFCIRWNLFEVDKNLPENPIYKTFDNRKQESMLNNEPKTNNMKAEDDFSISEPFVCNIYDKNFGFEIDFRIGDGFSGGGYSISVVKNRYNISAYSYSDSPSNAPEKDVKVLKSELILDKNSYKKGDRMYGYVNFKIQEKYGAEKYITEQRGYFKGFVK